MSEEPKTMSTLTGVILDVSGSMKSSISDEVDEEGGEWVRSVFKVIDNLIKNDVSDSNHMFAIGVGASCGNGVFDVMHTLEYCQLEEDVQSHSLTYDECIDRILQILQDGGAVAVRKWAKLDTIREVVPYETAKMLLRYLERKSDFVKTFVNDFLPEGCKGINNHPKAAAATIVTAIAAAAVMMSLISFLAGLITGPVLYYASNKALDIGETVAINRRPATPEEIIDVQKKAKRFLLKDILVPSSIMSVHKAADILHGLVEEKDLTKHRVQELMGAVKPFIYGRTPFHKSLEDALQLFSCSRFKDHKKLLYVVSDGMPTDSRNQCFSQLRDDRGITIVGCFITSSTDVEPRRLFDAADDNWKKGAKLLFELSSKITTQLIPRTIFIKRGWKIDINNNETKLFLHVNHPDIMKDGCKLARDVVCCQDALADVLRSVSLDIYINQTTGRFGAQTQVGGTCYANASAAVLHLSMKRILGRQGGYPDFYQLRQELIDEYGKDGANTIDVLKKVCFEYRLNCEEVTTRGAIAAVAGKRPVVATFRLTDDEWKIFSDFYSRNPTGILTRNELDITKRPQGMKTGGHAVVLTSYNSECLRLMNSWGTEWADMGFFSVQNAGVLGLQFIDVFWTVKDLTGNETEYYAKYGAKDSEKDYAKFLKNLKGLQVTTYQCPLCEKTSKVTEFTGQLLIAKCPKCHGKFKCDEPGNILALNMYLNFLSK